ncbi:hypothetical protein BZG29_02190 [Janthinobacterium sp. LM6]|nr:hypothetical protein BZG29_02190 [Janthinobacterium sp. LM6]
MRKDELQEAVARAAGVPMNKVTTKQRPGTQIKANALWEGSCTPAAARTAAGLFLAEDAPDLAFEGAIRRMTLPPPFPNTIIVLSEMGSELPGVKVFGYPDSSSAKLLAAALEVPVESVPRPLVTQVSRRPTEAFDIDMLLSNLRETPNIVLQGPPGTGKSSLVLALIRSLAETEAMTAEECRFGRLVAESGGDVDSFLKDASACQVPPVIWEFVQLHPGYAYDDLVRKVVPRTKDGVMHLRTEDSLLPRLCKLAEMRPDKPVILVLDEINRGNLAAILGEFVFAIDPGHRGAKVRLQYQGLGLAPAVSVPENLWIVGTMNTADRSIAMVDYAVRRRFRFLEVPASPTIVDQYYGSDSAEATVARKLFDECNLGLPSRLQIGHAAFLEDAEPSVSWPARMARKVVYNVFPLLSEYVKEGLRDVGPVSFNDEKYALDGQRAAALALTSSIRGMLASPQ